MLMSDKIELVSLYDRMLAVSVSVPVVSTAPTTSENDNGIVRIC